MTDGGGRWNLNSGDVGLDLGEQQLRRLEWMPEVRLGGSAATGSKWVDELAGSGNGRGGGVACTREEGRVLPFYRRLTPRKAVCKSFTTAHRGMARHGGARGARYGGEGGDVQATNVQWHKAARLPVSGETPRGTHHGPALCHAQGLVHSPQTDGRWPVLVLVYGGAAADRRDAGDVARALSRSRCQMF
jgi:hypothetical protein